MVFDYAILGGGVVGTAILNKLTRVGKKCVLIEKGNDVAIGTTKANTGLVHAGFDAKPGTLKAILNVKGAKMMEGLCKSLFVPFKRNGALVVGNDLKKLKKLYERGIKNGVQGLSIIDKKVLSKLVPNLNKDIKYALYAKTAGIVSPYELAIAFAEEAVINGAKVKFNYELANVQYIKDIYNLSNGKETIKVKGIINATGAGYNEVAKILGTEEYPITYRVGEYYLLDKTEIGLTNITVFPLPTETSKGVVVTPTVDGNILIGPNAVELSEVSTRTTMEGLKEVKDNAKQIFPNIMFNKNIRNFAGVRTVVGEDFVIEKSKKAKNIVNIAGICSPGLTAAPAIANMVVRELLEINTKERKIKQRTPIIHTKELSQEELNKLIRKDKNYGRIICRCEQVTAGEIISALNSPLKPTSIDAIKRRTKAGMGRCQGGFCLIDELELIAKIKNIPMESIVKENLDSNYIIADIKKLGDRK